MCALAFDIYVRITLSMKKPEVHTCSAEKLTPLMHKFRLKLASRMQDGLDLSWTNIWNEERQLLLEEVKDQPGLLQEVILEMGDAELFRRTGKFLSESKLFGGCHPCSRATSATLVTNMSYEWDSYRYEWDSYR